MFRIISIICVLFCLNVQAESEGIQFFHGTLEEAKEAAKRENKLIFVDCYTTWCGPCKMLSKYVFTDPEMAEFYNANFINLKLDMEAEGRMFAIEYGISAYPTLLFIDHNGTVFKRIVGGRDAKTFILEGTAAMTPDESVIKKMQERFDTGEREEEFLKSYIRNLSKAGKPLEIPLREYISLQSDAKQKEAPFTDFIFEVTNHILSKGTSILKENEALYKERYGVNKYEDKLLSIGTASVKDAVKNKDEVNYKKSMSFVSSLKNPDNKKIQMQLSLLWYESIQDWSHFAKVANNYLLTYGLIDSPESIKIVQKMDRLPIEVKYLKYAEKGHRFMSAHFNTYTVWYPYTRYMMRIANLKEAESAYKKVQELANEDQKVYMPDLGIKINQLRLSLEKPASKAH